MKKSFLPAHAIDFTEHLLNDTGDKVILCLSDCDKEHCVAVMNSVMCAVPEKTECAFIIPFDTISSDSVYAILEQIPEHNFKGIIGFSGYLADNDVHPTILLFNTKSKQGNKFVEYMFDLWQNPDGSFWNYDAWCKQRKEATDELKPILNNL